MCEVDLLIAAPSGIHMVELKSWRGDIEVNGGKWVQTTEAGEVIEHADPVQLTVFKSSALARLLRAVGEDVYIRALLCLTNDRVRAVVPARDRRFVVSLGGFDETARATYPRGSWTNNHRSSYPGRGGPGSGPDRPGDNPSRVNGCRSAVARGGGSSGPRCRRACGTPGIHSSSATSCRRSVDRSGSAIADISSDSRCMEWPLNSGFAVIGVQAATDGPAFICVSIASLDATFDRSVCPANWRDLRVRGCWWVLSVAVRGSVTS